MIYVSDGVDITTDQVQTEHVTRMIFGHYTDNLSTTKTLLAMQEWDLLKEEIRGLGKLGILLNNLSLQFWVS